MVERPGLGGNKGKDVGACKEEDSSSGEVVKVIPQTGKKRAKRVEFYTKSDVYDTKEDIDRARKAGLHAE